MQTTRTPAVIDHTMLPDEDGAVASNFHEHPQSTLLNSCLWPRLQALFGGQFLVGCDGLIYWRMTDPALDGAKAPDWFLVPDVPPSLDGGFRRSYVLWRENVRPLVVVEYVSGDGSEERDKTPDTGKFWVYERAIGADYYVVFDRPQGSFEVYRLTDRAYRRLEPNAAGRVPIAPLGVEFGLWEGTFQNVECAWLRAWDAPTGLLLPTENEQVEAQRERAETAESLVDDFERLLGEETERAEKERKRAEAAEQANAKERKRAEAAEAAADKLAAMLRELGIDPSTVE